MYILTPRFDCRLGSGILLLPRLESALLVPPSEAGEVCEERFVSSPFLRTFGAETEPEEGVDRILELLRCTSSRSRSM